MAKIYDKQPQFDFITAPHKNKFVRKKIKKGFCLYRNLVKSREKKKKKKMIRNQKRNELSSCYDPTGEKKEKIGTLLTFDHVMILSSFGTKSQFAGSLSFKNDAHSLVCFLKR